MKLKMVFLLFFLSGLAGLIYEIVWGRQFVLIFGATTNSLVAVISAFLGGLALGSLIISKFVDKLEPKSLLKVYALLETGVGIFGALSLVFIPGIRNFYAYFSDGSQVTLSLLIIKFTLAILVVLVPTTLMGATLPILVRLISLQKNLPAKTVSLLYAVNTFGGVIGTALSAFILIELLGLKNTILFAAGINFSIAILANLIKVGIPNIKHELKFKEPVNNVFSPFFVLIMVSFFLSGLISVAYQILWTRVLTPGLGTVIYAFASILIVYLFGIALGSILYQKLSSVVKSRYLLFALCEAGIGFFALIAVIIFHKVSFIGGWELLIRVLPPTILMGLTFPAVIALVGKTNIASGKAVGLSYASNTIGTIFGGFLASFVLIPKLGTSQAIVFLSGFNFLISAIFLVLDKESKPIYRNALLTIVGLFLIVSSGIMAFRADRLFPLKTDYLIQDAKMRNEEYGFKEDEVASVFAINDLKNKEQHLIIDGVNTTHRVAETRLMAHIPLTIYPEAKKVLVVAFGMGTSYRSALKQGREVDAVELVPSVPGFMSLFHTDAKNYQSDSKGKVIINDGRNYAFLTHKKYDVVIIDPPPPFNTAGSTVLHSKEFYQDLSKKLNSGGIVSQWIYYNRSREDEISMAIKSFVEVFPYVLAIQNKSSVGGMFLLGSYEEKNKDLLLNIYNDPVAINDLQEVFREKIIPKDHLPLEVFAKRDNLLSAVKNYPPITDDNPRSEYYLLRHYFSDSPLLVNKEADNFIEKIKKSVP